MILYKYLSDERIDVLKNRTIRFTQPSELNDPFEVRPAANPRFCINKVAYLLDQATKVDLETLYFQYQEDPVSLMGFDFGAINYAEFKQLISVISMALRHPDVGKNIDAGRLLNEEIYKISNSSIGILSLTEKANNILMWSHYCNSHQGYVIGFDAEHAYFSGTKHHDEERKDLEKYMNVRKVTYNVKRPILSGGIEDMGKIYFAKSPDWEYESEWRITRNLKRLNNISGTNIYLSKLPSECIKKVILGAEVSSKIKSEISYILDEDPAYKNVTLFSAKLDPKEFKIIFEEL